MLAKKFTTELAGRTLTVEVGKLALQAHGSCTVTYGETVVLGTAVISPDQREGVDFFPLMVDYEERLYAAGKIKGSRFIKREGRATDEAILTARLIDRSIRPLFNESDRNDIQVVVTVLSYDGVNDPDVPAMIASSLALAISPIPWKGPLAGVKVGRINGELVLNPTVEALAKSDFELFLSGSAEEAIMIEAGAKQIPEEEMSTAIKFAAKHIKNLMPFIQQIISEVGEAKHEPNQDQEKVALRNLVQVKVSQFLDTQDLTKCFHPDKTATKEAIAKIKTELEASLKADNEVNKDMRAIGMAMFELSMEKAFKDLVLRKKIRPDGRQFDELRTLSAEVGILPRTHGTGLFKRGETQVLSIVTLGSPGDEQTLDTMEESGHKKYMHHYNFPGFSVGEVRPLRGPGRREIGHGALAEKALVPVLPENEEFPYTIRVVSEVLGSNGSTSQASICGSSLSLMDAGVPIKAAVAGIAMGLVLDDNNPGNYQLLTDIQGIEDHAGHMDFKVAGTRTGITAIQLDIKLGGISYQIVDEALAGAKTARHQILDVMDQVISQPRADLSPYAPRITVMQIDPEKIREVIGSGGKIINEIIDKCNVQIDIEQSGLVMITSTDAEGAARAKTWIENIVKELAVGEIYEGPVSKIVTDKNTGAEIGAIVELLPGKDGMVHISQVSHEHIRKVTDRIKVGDVVKVKVVAIDKEKNRVSLSIKDLLPRPAGLENAPQAHERKNFFKNKFHK